MQSKDWWFNPVEGGAGGWDNRLFRLGEMMSYMGTPLSKRGDNPAKRWTTAHSASEKLKADLAKAQAKTDDFKDFHKWTPAQVRENVGGWFDSQFGWDFPGGKDRDIEKERFIRDVTDAKRLYKDKTVDEIMKQLMLKGNYK